MLCDAATGGVFPEAAYQTTCHTYSDAVGCPASTGMQALLELVVEQSRAIQLLQDALDSLPNGFSLSDAGGRLVMCNRAFADLHDREPEAMIGTSRAERVRIFLPNMLQFDGIPMSNSAQDAERWLRRLNRTLSEPVEMELNDGSWKLVTSTPTAEGGRVTICTDISQQKKTEFALYEAQQLLSAFFRHAPIAMNLKDINSRYQMVNKSFTD